MGVGMFLLGKGPSKLSLAGARFRPSQAAQPITMPRLAMLVPFPLVPIIVDNNHYYYLYVALLCFFSKLNEIY